MGTENRIQKRLGAPTCRLIVEGIASVLRNDAPPGKTSELFLLLSPLDFLDLPHRESECRYRAPYVLGRHLLLLA